MLTYAPHRRCCGRAGSTGRCPSTCPPCRTAWRSSRCICAHSRPPKTRRSLPRGSARSQRAARAVRHKPNSHTASLSLAVKRGPCSNARGDMITDTSFSIIFHLTGFVTHTPILTRTLSRANFQMNTVIRLPTTAATTALPTLVSYIYSRICSHQPTA